MHTILKKACHLPNQTCTGVRQIQRDVPPPVDSESCPDWIKHRFFVFVEVMTTVRDICCLIEESAPVQVRSFINQTCND